MADAFHLSHAAGRVAVDPACGHLADLALRCGDDWLHPLFRAPWADRAGDLDPGMLPVLRHLSGDFFCAPFSDSDVQAGPPHGPTANAPWREIGRADDRLTLACSETVLNARVEKTLRFRGDDPVLYQEHRLVGGDGRVPVAHHVMIRAAEGCRLSTSPKRFVATPPTTLEPDPALGRSILAYPQRVDGLDGLARVGGERVDARTYPFADRHEDLAMMVERDLSGIGWTTAALPSADFLLFLLKPSRTLPATVLWFSNGGRDYPPFDRSPGRVLGIEDACTFFHVGHRASIEPNWVSAEGVPTALALDPAGARTVRHALGVVPIDASWSGDVTLTVSADRLTLQDAAGPSAAVPFDKAWLTADGA